MIEKIGINNFKCISELSLVCKPLNVLVGVNSSGKSTVIQSLLLASQNLENDNGLNGALIKPGKFEEVHSKWSLSNEPIRISLVGDGGQLYYKFFVSDGKPAMTQSANDNTENLKKRLNYNTRGLQYLSCNRIGPQDSYKENMSLNEQIGVNGEYAVAFLYHHRTDQLESDMCANRVDLTLGGQVNSWLYYITGAKITTTEVPEADIVVASYSNAGLSNIRPYNIGAGISYVLSILVAGLSSHKKSTLIIENPEIHLHPRAQARLCEFLYFIAENGRQIFIETHSDHIFNGFRAGIANNSMRKDNIAIDFFTINDKSCTDVIPIDIGAHGRIINQQKDLFDQFDIDLNRMLGLEKNDTDFRRYFSMRTV